MSWCRTILMQFLKNIPIYFFSIFKSSLKHFSFDVMKLKGLCRHRRSLWAQTSPQSSVYHVWATMLDINWIINHEISPSCWRPLLFPSLITSSKFRVFDLWLAELVWQLSSSEFLLHKENLLPHSVSKFIASFEGIRNGFSFTFYVQH